MDEIQKLRKELYEMVQNLKELLFNTKVNRTNGILVFCKHKEPKSFKIFLDNEIHDLKSLLEKANFLLTSHEFKELKANISSTLTMSKITLIYEKTKENWAEKEIALYNEFKKVQQEQQRNIRNYLIGESRSNNDNQVKHVWLGEQKQLVELFNMLIKKGWIKNYNTQNFPERAYADAISRMFLIEKKGKEEEVNPSSFAKEWNGEIVDKTRVRPGDEDYEGYKKCYFNGIKENK